MSVQWPRTVHRTCRAADPVARACPLERHRRRRPAFPWIVGVALVGAVAMLAVHITR